MLSYITGICLYVYMVYIYNVALAMLPLIYVPCNAILSAFSNQGGQRLSHLTVCSVLNFLKLLLEMQKLMLYYSPAYLHDTKVLFVGHYSNFVAIWKNAFFTSSSTGVWSQVIDKYNYCKIVIHFLLLKIKH